MVHHRIEMAGHVIEADSIEELARKCVAVRHQLDPDHSRVIEMKPAEAQAYPRDCQES